jgi:hypothetical protein
METGDQAAIETVVPPSTATRVHATDQLTLIMKDYGYVQSAIDKIDGQRFQIRNWAIVSAGALFTVSLSARIPLIAFAGIATTAFFAFLEGIYQDMVVGVIHRSNKLDEFVNSYKNTGTVPDTYVFGMKQAFLETFSFHGMLTKVLKKDRIHVTAFYAGLLLVNAAGGLAVILR